MNDLKSFLNNSERGSIDIVPLFNPASSDISNSFCQINATFEKLNEHQNSRSINYFDTNFKLNDDLSNTYNRFNGNNNKSLKTFIFNGEQ